ncbi:MAG: DUF3322 domain-containing protein [Acetobacteraceae bacterium]
MPRRARKRRKAVSTKVEAWTLCRLIALITSFMTDSRSQTVRRTLPLAGVGTKRIEVLPSSSSSRVVTASS